MNGIDYILVEKDTDEKVSHAYFPFGTPDDEINEWLEGVDTDVYDIYVRYIPEV